MKFRKSFKDSGGFVSLSQWLGDFQKGEEMLIKNKQNKIIEFRKSYQRENEPYLKFLKWDKWVRENLEINSTLWDDLDINLKIDLYGLFG